MVHANPYEVTTNDSQATPTFAKYQHGVCFCQQNSGESIPLLFGILYRMKLVEHVDSGIKRIKEALAADY